MDDPSATETPLLDCADERPQPRTEVKSRVSTLDVTEHVLADQERYEALELPPEAP